MWVPNWWKVLQSANSLLVNRVGPDLSDMKHALEVAQVEMQILNRQCAGLRESVVVESALIQDKIISLGNNAAQLQTLRAIVQMQTALIQAHVPTEEQIQLANLIQGAASKYIPDVDARDEFYTQTFPVNSLMGLYTPSSVTSVDVAVDVNELLAEATRQDEAAVPESVNVTLTIDELGFDQFGEYHPKKVGGF
jgi:hypothetical protein